MKHIRKGFFISFLLLVGCAGLGDFSVDLSGGYSIIRTSAHMVTIAPKINDSLYGEDTIPPKVTEIAWNDHYIIAKQLPLVDDQENESNYKIPDEKHPFYWIIDVKSDTVFGPYTVDQFNKQREELVIPNNLLLKKVDEYRR